MIITATRIDDVKIDTVKLYQNNWNKGRKKKKDSQST
jgi:hypothetical protein